jgi:hypothetical protein
MDRRVGEGTACAPGWELGPGQIRSYATLDLRE